MSLVPNLYPVSINGRGYMVDLSRDILRNGFREQTVSLIRNQADNSAVPSEASINPEDLWRRSAESWHHGAGQTNLDRPDSDPFRFRSSLGIDVWTRYQMSLLGDTTLTRVGSASDGQYLTVGSYLYIRDGNNVYWTQDITVASPTWTSANIQAGETPVAVYDIATDGSTVWASVIGNGIHATTKGATTSSHYSDVIADTIGYVKGRLMASAGAQLYNITAGGAGTVLWQHPNTNFQFVGFAPGATCIYIAGHAGDVSLIYRTAVKADGTALDIPVVAGELPDGETVYAIDGYLGYVLIGTDKGVRLASADASGNLTIGRLIPTSSPVRCFEAQDRFVWFGWTNYDANHTGLGRLDLSTFTDTLTPAYATDLMANPTQGTIYSVATFQNRRVFVMNQDFYVESADKVASGTLDSGLLGYGLSDEKTAMALTVKHRPLTYGSHKGYVSADSGSFTLVGTHTSGGSEGTFTVGPTAAETFEVRTELDRDGTTKTQGPTVTRWTLRAEPTPPRTVTFTLPLLLYEQVTCLDGAEREFDCAAAYADIKSLVQDGTLTTFAIGTDTYAAAFVKDYDFLRQKPTEDNQAWQGQCVVLVKVPTV